MTQEAAILFLLQQGPQSCSDFIRSDFHLAASYRRAITMLRKKLKPQGLTIRLHPAIKRDTVVLVPAKYHLEPIEQPMVEPNGQLRLAMV